MKFKKKRRAREGWKKEDLFLSKMQDLCHELVVEEPSSQGKAQETTSFSLGPDSCCAFQKNGGFCGR